MKTIRVVQFADPKEFLGETVKLVLKSGGMFNLRVTGCDEYNLHGFDEYRLNMSVAFSDLEHVIGNRTRGGNVYGEKRFWSKRSNGNESRAAIVPVTYKTSVGGSLGR